MAGASCPDITVVLIILANEGIVHTVTLISVTSWRNRGRRSERPGKQRQMGRTMVVSLMTWCQRCARARSSTKTCPRWNATANASTARLQTQAESDRSQNSTSERRLRSASLLCSPTSTPLLPPALLIIRFSLGRIDMHIPQRLLCCHPARL